ncbi:MAG TPA: sugar MFS transporter [Steroidobacteraceae bacterium]|jgi:FHS family L-fucose permease-like MFS transporter|nr:sugar MFS transporter [Steroidobacteraceae bacterium]
MNADNKYKGMGAGFATVTTLFFMWGFITVSIDPLIAALKSIFELNYAEAMLAQFAFFMAYFVVSLPAAALIARLGNSKSIIFALGVMVAGCLIVPAATHFDTFALVLVALFVIASGITILQVVANPLAAELGPPERSHFRLTFSQAFNSFGTWLAPRLVSGVILAGGIFAVTHGAQVTPELRADSFRRIDSVFLAIAGALVLLAIFIFVFRRLLDVVKPVDEGQRPSVMTALKSRWGLIGAVAIFLYVGAEVSIGSAMTNFLHEPDMLNVSLEEAGKLVSYYWGGAMVGRFIGSGLLTFVRAHRLLAVFALGACLLCLSVTQLSGSTAAYLALSIGLFNSIMFPVIFTLTLERSSAAPAATSGLLCLAIVGGAILPYIYGMIADAAGLHTAYFLPAVAYALIVVIALAAAGARIYAHGAAATTAGH